MGIFRGGSGRSKRTDYQHHVGQNALNWESDIFEGKEIESFTLEELLNRTNITEKEQFMNAAEAKKQAELNRDQMKENVKIREDKAKLANVDVLLNHFKAEIATAVKAGLLSTKACEFPIDRFTDEVIRAVSQELNDEGYTLNSEKHNAFKTCKFTVSWA